MDTIAIGVCSDKDVSWVEQLLLELHLESPTYDFWNDAEIREGLRQFCASKHIVKLLFLVKSRSDTTSNDLSQEFLDDFLHERSSRLERLAQAIESYEADASVWLLFAFSWEKNDLIHCYSGSAEQLKSFMHLNGGPYSLIYSVEHDTHNADLDTPLAWLIQR